MASSHFTLRKFLLASCALFSLSASAQQTNLGGCSQANVPIVNGGTAPVFTVTQSNSASGLSYWGSLVGNTNPPQNVVNNTLSDFARGNILATGTLQLSVKDATNDYNAGNFAGFVVDLGALNVNVLGAVTLRTYLTTGGTRVLRESSSGAQLIALGLLSGTTRPLGFYTNKSFDEVEIDIASGIGLGAYDVYYAIMQGTGSCTSPALVCNANTAPVFPTYATVVNPANTGVSGSLITLSALANTGNVVDNDPTTFATISTSVSVGGSANIAVKDLTTDYPAGTYAGFDIENSLLANVGVFSNGIGIRTYRNDTLQETRSGTNLLVGANVLNGSTGRQKIGFLTTLPFDEVQLFVNQGLVSVDLGTTRVYSAILKQLCAAPALVCNTPRMLNETAAPVFVALENTGINGVCVNCKVESPNNVLDGNSTTAAQIDLLASVTGSGSIAIRDALTQYDSGTFVGFDIESAALLDLGVLSGITVTTYLNGALKNTFTGNGLLVDVGLLGTGNTARVTVGNLATAPFNEVRLTATQTATVTLGNTSVYGVTVTKPCAGVIACNGTYVLNNADFPSYINAARTGTAGLACVGCNVTGAGNVISADTTDYAVLSTVAGVAAATSLSVSDAVSTYPAGTIAGFTIAETNNILQANLFKTLTITTYNNGVLQESRSGGQLLNLSALILQINPTTGSYNIGFPTTLPFDEVRISAAPVVGVTPVIRVYGAFVDTRYLSGSALGTLCNKAPIASPDHLSTLINTPIGGNLKTNDRDPQGSALTYNSIPVTPPANGTVIINADGSFSYTPASGFTGVDSFQYSVCNTGGSCATAFAYVSTVPASTPGAANRPPLAQPDFSQTLLNTSVTGNARRNDVEPDGNPITYTTLTPPEHGTLILNANGTYTYTPDSSYVGNDRAILQACDNGTPALCATSQLLLQVSPDTNGGGNDAPFAQDDVASGSENRTITGYVFDNDSDPNGDSLTATLLDAVPAASGTIFFASDGGYSFLPATGFNGTVSLRYAVCDGGTPSLCDTATLTLTIVPILGPDYTPLLVFDSTDFGASLVTRDFLVTISSLSASPSNSPLVLKILKPTAFTVTFSSATTNSAVNGGTAVSNSNWTFTQTNSLITCTLNSGVTLAGNSQQSIGFSIVRKPGITPGTLQNMTTTIVAGSGGDSNNANNQSTKNLKTK